MKYNLILKKTFFYDLVKNKEKINNLNSIELNRFSISNYSQFEQEVENFILKSEKKSQFLFKKGKYPYCTILFLRTLA